MRSLSLVGLVLLAGCAGGAPGLRPEVSGGSRSDGIVTLSSVRSIYTGAEADWSEAAADADRRCRGWGYDSPSRFSGWSEKCLAYDRHGRCISTEVTRFYDCAG
jgi:hypothetical protein